MHLFEKENQFLLEITDVHNFDYTKILKTNCIHSHVEYDVKLEGFWGMTEINIKNKIRLVDPIVEDGKVCVTCI